VGVFSSGSHLKYHAESGCSGGRVGNWWFFTQINIYFGCDRIVYSLKLAVNLRAGAAGCQNHQPGCQKKNLGAKRQKNRSRENAFAEVLPRRPKFGVRSEKNRTVRFCDGHERRSRV